MPVVTEGAMEVRGASEGLVDIPGEDSAVAEAAMMAARTAAGATQAEQEVAVQALGAH